MAADTPERWRRIAALFDEALKVPPAQREAFLESACSGDADLRRRVAELLEASGGAAGFLEQPIVPRAARILRELADEPIPASAAPYSDHPSSAPTHSVATGAEIEETIGPYHLLQRIGEGGMGEVWLAEQREPIRREVALKVIKAGMDTKQVVARFEAERQAMALMDHPCIAKVFEAGETPRGLPYFAMEHVPGEPITLYCDRNRLTMQDRLDLFRQVCDGVQHAHQKGVIHRDLKPSNVLVMIVGEKPVPKIIDFGVAKATSQRLTERTLFTDLGVMIGTPEYMSPEQADMTAVDVDTRTDVYALGVMLYELLTGVLPFEPKELRHAGFEEIRRHIREVDPPRPSTRVRALGARSTEAAKRRRIEPRKLVSRLKGDLDWIVMKSLEKDRARRYGSPADLGAEIDRHLKNEPVLAGPPSAFYRARKFARRHRFGVAAAAAGIVGLVAFGALMAVQARRIAIERNRAERVSNFFAGMFRVSSPGEARGKEITAREILDKGAQKIENELAKEPEVQAQLMLTIGSIYSELGLYDKAEPILKRSVEIRRRILGKDHRRTLNSMEYLAYVYERTGRYAEAEKLDSIVTETRRRVLGEKHPHTLRSMEKLGFAYGRHGHHEEALKIQLGVLEARRRVLPENDNRTVWSMHNIAVEYEALGRYKEAEALYREALAIRRQVLGPDHPDTLWIENSLGKVARDQRKYDEAERLFRETYDGRRLVLGADHPDTLDTRENLAGMTMNRGHWEEARGIYLEILEARRRVLGPDHPSIFRTLASLAWALHQQGHHAEAETLVRQAYEGQRRALGEDDPDTLMTKQTLAIIIQVQGRLEEARGIYVEVLDARRRVLGPEHPRTMATKNNLAVVLLDQKRYEAAEKLFRQILEVDRRVLGPDHHGTLAALNNLGEVCAEQKRLDEAETFYTQALEIGDRVLGPRHPDTLSVHIGLAGVAALRGRRAQALAMIRQAVEAGYNDPADEMEKQPTLHSLHGDPQFQRLLAVARAKRDKKDADAP